MLCLHVVVVDLLVAVGNRTLDHTVGSLGEAADMLHHAEVKECLLGHEEG